MIIVLAGNYQQFMHYLREEDLNPRVAVFADGRMAYRGTTYTKEDIIVYGTFWERPDAGKLHEEVFRYAR